MGARRDLGHDAAIGRVGRVLPGEAVGEDARSPVTSAAAVSSHEDSRPRISMAWALAGGAGLSKPAGSAKSDDRDPAQRHGMTRRVAVLRPSRAMPRPPLGSRRWARGPSGCRCSRSGRWPGRRPIPRGFDALLLTSANAVPARRGRAATLARTAGRRGGGGDRARGPGGGLAVETVGTGDVADSGAASGRARLLHLCGREHVAAGGEAVAVYAAEALPIDSVGAAGGLRGADPFGARGAAAGGAGRRDRIADLRVAAISAAVRAAGPDVRGAVAERPDDAALVALAARLAAD